MAVVRALFLKWSHGLVILRALCSWAISSCGVILRQMGTKKKPSTLKEFEAAIRYKIALINKRYWAEYKNVFEKD